MSKTVTLKSETAESLETVIYFTHAVKMDSNQFDYNVFGIVIPRQIVRALGAENSIIFAPGVSFDPATGVVKGTHEVLVRLDHPSFRDEFPVGDHSFIGIAVIDRIIVNKRATTTVHF